MKKTLILLTALSLAPGAMSQPNQIGFPVIGLQQNPGVFTYDNQQLDRTKIIQSNMEIDAENKALIMSLLTETKQSIQSLRSLVLGSPGNRSLSDIASDGFSESPRYIHVSEFMKLKGVLNSEISKVQQAVAILEAVKTKDGKTTITIEGKSIELNARITPDIAETAKVYSKSANEILAQAANIQFRVSGGALTGALFETANIAQPLPASLTQVASTEIEKMQAAADAVKNNRKTNEAVYTSLRGLGTVTRNRLKAIIQVMGKSQNGKPFQLNEEGMKTALSNFQEIMLSRTVLRYNFGTPIGTIGVNYVKLFANLDQLGISNAIEILDYDISNENDVLNVQDMTKNNLEKAKRKSQEVFGKGVPFLSRVMSAINKVRLQDAWGQVNTYVLDLLVQDIEQEMLMSTILGKQRLHTQLGQKLAANPEWAAEAFPKIKAFDTMSKAPKANGNAQGEDGFLGSFNTAATGLRTFKTFWDQYLVMSRNIAQHQSAMSALANPGGAEEPSLSNLMPGNKPQ